MEFVIPHVTQLRNGSRLVALKFLAVAIGFTIAGLNPGKKTLVDLPKILKICRHLESTSWTIDILMNGRSSGLMLEAHHLLDYVLIVLELKRVRKGKYILMAKGVREKKIDVILRMGRGIGALLGRDRIWRRRKLEVIAEAPQKYARRVRPVRKKENPLVGTKCKDSMNQKEVNPYLHFQEPELPIEREGRYSLFFAEQQIVHNIEHNYQFNEPETTTANSVVYLFLFLVALLVIVFIRVVQLL